MKTAVRRAAIIATIVACYSTSAFACGDKIVVFGRGVRFRSAYAAANPASILVFMNASSRLPALDRQFHIVSILKLAGHKPVEVESPEELTQALRLSTYDVLLLDLADADSVRGQIDRLPVKPAFLPIVDRDKVAAGDQRYSCVMRASKKNHELLALVDKVMRGKNKGAEALCSPAGGM
jgi:hypothetical protein